MGDRSIRRNQNTPTTYHTSLSPLSGKHIPNTRTNFRNHIYSLFQALIKTFIVVFVTILHLNMNLLITFLRKKQHGSLFPTNCCTVTYDDHVRIKNLTLCRDTEELAGVIRDIQEAGHTPIVSYGELFLKDRTFKVLDFMYQQERLKLVKITYD